VVRRSISDFYFCLKFVTFQINIFVFLCDKFNQCEMNRTNLFVRLDWQKGTVFVERLVGMRCLRDDLLRRHLSSSRGQQMSLVQASIATLGVATSDVLTSNLIF